MSNPVFIAWGGNKELAGRLAEVLSLHGHSPIVGGDEGDPRAVEYFLGATVFRQMREATRAIILADKQPADQPPFRANLLFELGYLSARLPAGYLHVFLIDVSRRELPSDLVGMWCREVSASGDTEQDADSIAAAFIDDLRISALNGQWVLTRWAEEYRQWLSTQVDGDSSPDGHRLAGVLLHSLQASLYAGDRDFLKGIVARLTEQTPRELNQAATLVREALAYYSATDTKKLDLGSIRRSAKVFAYRPQWLSPSDPLHVWLEIVRLDFLGLCLHKLGSPVCESPSGQEQLRLARNAFLESHAFLEALESPEQSALLSLWKGYVLRNLGRTKHLLGEGDALAILDAAKDCRLAAFAYFNSLVPPGVAGELFLEANTLIDLDRARIVGSGDRVKELLREAWSTLKDPAFARTTAMWKRADGQVRELAKQVGIRLSAR